MTRQQSTFLWVLGGVAALFWWKSSPGLAGISSDLSRLHLDASSIAKMAAGVLPNPAGFTIGDAHIASLISRQVPVDDAARLRLRKKLARMV